MDNSRLPWLGFRERRTQYNLLLVCTPGCGGGGGDTPLCGLYRYVRPQGCGFLAVLVINRASILAILVINRVWFLHSSPQSGVLF